MKGAKLTKLKSALRKWPSFSKLDRTSIAANEDSSVREAAGAGNMHTVYVGRSRRRYLVSSEVIEHPLFRVLVRKSDGSGEISVACEVVLFDHLLWMLQNGESGLDAMDELVEFYSC
ncbi:hypothetical protein NMG60_11004016 [Bertholletia excelsa]